MVDLSDSKSDAGLGLLPRLRCDAAAAGLGGEEIGCVGVEEALVETVRVLRTARLDVGAGATGFDTDEMRLEARSCVGVDSSSDVAAVLRFLEDGVVAADDLTSTVVTAAVVGLASRSLAGTLMALETRVKLPMLADALGWVKGVFFPDSLDEG